MALPRSEGVSRTIVLLTDGYIDAERDVFEFIRSHLDETNVFAFGIGSGVNRYLIEGVARAGLGDARRGLTGFRVRRPGRRTSAP